MVALCDDNTARFLDVGQRRLIKAVPRPGLGPPLSPSVASSLASSVCCQAPCACSPEALCGALLQWPDLQWPHTCHAPPCVPLLFMWRVVLCCSCGAWLFRMVLLTERGRDSERG